MKRIVIIIICGLIFINAYSQNPINNNYKWEWAYTSNNLSVINNQYATSIAVDNEKNVIMSGTFLNFLLTLGTNNVELYNNDSSGTNKDFFIAKYDQYGSVIWARKALCSGSSISNKVVVDSSGNIYATGYLNSNNQTVSFDGITNYTYPVNGVGQSFLVKYSPEGITQWALIIKNTNAVVDSITALKWDPITNSVIIGGAFYGDTIKIGGYTLSSTTNNYSSLFLAKVSSQGTVDWGTNTKGTTQFAYINDITTDNAGAIYYAATFYGQYVLYPNYDTIVNYNQNNYSTYSDGFFVKFNSDGIFQWTRKGNCSLSDGINTISYNNKSNSIIIGGNLTTQITFNSGSSYTINGQNYIAVYDLLGNIKSANAFPASINKITCNNNSPYFTIGGSFNTDSLILGSITLHNLGFNSGTTNSNMYIADYDTSGIVQKAISAGGSGSSSLYDLFADDSCQVYVCGSYGSPINFDSIQYSYNGLCFFIAKLDTANSFTSPVVTKYNLGGTVFANLLPADFATVYLFDSINSCVDSCAIDSFGFYNFYQKPIGNYKLKAFLSSSSSFINDYAPTYFTNSLFWNTADTIKLNMNKWGQDIHLKALNLITTGQGSIEGTVTGAGTGLLPKVEVLLLDTANHPLIYKFTDVNGVFNFSNLTSGKYKIFPEVTGKTTNPDIITLDASNPSVNNINFIVSSATITLSVEENEELIGKLSNIYPDPATNEIIIDILPKRVGDYKFKIINTIGQIVYSETFSLNQMSERVKINTSSYPTGLFQLIISDNSNNKSIKRFIITK